MTFACRLAAVYMAVILAAACGGGGGSSPSSPSPSPASLSIQPATDFLKVGSVETFTAQSTLSNGSTQIVTAAWSTDNPGVATVDSGRVTGMAAGEAAITAEYQGSRASRRIRVAPDYEGSWSGSYRITGCSETGDWAAQRICDDLDVVGEPGPMQLRLTQQRTSVDGTLTLGTVAGAVTGTITVPGSLELQGALAYQDSGSTGTITLADWSTRLENRRMTGAFTQVWSAPGAVGDLRLSCVLESLPPSAAAAPAGLAVTSVGSGALAARIRTWLGVGRRLGR